MRRLLATRAKNPRLGNDLAIRVSDPGLGRSVYSKTPDEAQVPASNMKLVTAFVALKTMGPTARMTTRVVRGTSGVTLIGGGDPMLNNSRLDKLASGTVKSLAAASSTGRAPKTVKVYYNDAMFPKHSNPRGWRSSYVTRAVNPVSALARFGQRTTRPGYDTARYFANRLTARGVKATVVGRTTSTSGTEAVRIAGVTIETAVRRMLLVSDNNVAEVLARNAAVATKRPATWSGMRTTVRAVLRSEGVPLLGVSIVDGSGLSRSSRLTTRSISWVLTRAMRSPDPRLKPYLSTMAVAGRTGTIAKSYGRYNTSPTRCATGLVRAKTGYIQGTYALSGVAIAADGRPRVFSFVANKVSNTRYPGLEVRRALDRLAATVTGCY